MTFASCVNSSSLIYIIKRSVVFGLLSEFSNILLRVSLEFLSVCESAMRFHIFLASNFRLYKTLFLYFNHYCGNFSFYLIVNHHSQPPSGSRHNLMCCVTCNPMLDHLFTFFCHLLAA